jgi:Tol biopolymer transport system component
VLLVLMISACDQGRVTPGPTLGVAVTPSAPIESVGDLDSPSGVLVFAEGRSQDGRARLFTMWPDGSHRHEVATDPLAHFAIAPDHQQVVIEGSTTSVIRIDGGSSRTLPDIGLGTEFFTWSGDGTHFYFNAWSDDDPALDGLYVARASDLGEATRLNGDHPPVLVSPSGDRIVTIADIVAREGHRDIANLYVQRADGQDRRRLNPPGTAVLVEPGFGPAGSWSPNGASIVFAAFDTTTTLDWSLAASALYVSDALGEEVHRITATGVGAGPTAQWSPDGAWIATTSTDGTAAVEQVFLVRPDGADLHAITHLAAPGSCCAVWSPDSQRLVTARLTVIDLAGTATGLAPNPAVDPFQYTWITTP